MIVIAFFFLLRPGEYTVTTDNSPFRLQDIQLRIGDQRLSWHSATEHQLLCATFATLEFTTQKNAVRGEVIGQGRSGSHHFCPVKSIARRLLHLRRHGADPATPLASYYSEHRWCSIKPADISDVLKLATTARLCLRLHPCRRQCSLSTSIWRNGTSQRWCGYRHHPPYRSMAIG